MLNRKGFTLIEVIVVVSIMALFVVIIVPRGLSIMNQNNIKSCVRLEDNILSATKIYVTENKYDLAFSCNEEKEITLEELQRQGELTGRLINPLTKKEVEVKSVKVIYDCDKDKFNYEYDLKCTTDK